ncbi:MAG: hypothetical protein IT297_08630 [Anaerolineae bacterium]|nr:hypothetical protein [Anaerolineae bacterium]
MTDITERAAAILAVLRTREGVWMSRIEIAKAHGKRKLQAHDVELLRRLEAAGLVETRTRRSNTPVGTAFEYRAVSGRD